MSRYGQLKKIGILDDDLMATINQELIRSTWKVVKGWSTWTKKGVDSLVRGARFCPDCCIIFKIEMMKKNCRNGECTGCKQWYCMRCMQKMRSIGDHSCQHCVEAGYQNIVNGYLVYIDDGRPGN